MKTILGNFVFINEENKSKEIQSKNVLSFTKFVLGGFCLGVFGLGGFCLGFFVRGCMSGGFCPVTIFLWTARSIEVVTPVQSQCKIAMNDEESSLYYNGNFINFTDQP